MHMLAWRMWLAFTSTHVTTRLEQNRGFLVGTNDTFFNLLGRKSDIVSAIFGNLWQKASLIFKTFFLWHPTLKPSCDTHLRSGLHLLLAHQALPHSRWAEGTSGHMSARSKQCVTLHIGAHHTFLESFLFSLRADRDGRRGRLSAAVNKQNERRLRLQILKLWLLKRFRWSNKKTYSLTTVSPYSICWAPCTNSGPGINQAVFDLSYS